MGLSDLVVGLTVVAFGTSAPELTISMISAIEGSSAMAIGNVVGSNIFNVLVIIGITALIVPIKVGKGLMLNEIPLVVLSSIVLLAIGMQPQVDRTDGILLLCFFAIFMRYVLAQAKELPAPEGASAPEATAKAPEMGICKACMWVVVGLVCLVFGGNRFVAGASDIAHTLGVSQAVIGLTIVAMGTSLPEARHIGRSSTQRARRHGAGQRDWQQYFQHLPGAGPYGYHHPPTLRRHHDDRLMGTLRLVRAVLALR